MPVIAWEYSVRWGNPYTEPPDGMPRVLLTVQVPPSPGGGAPGAPPEIDRVWREANAAFVASLPPGSPVKWPWSVCLHDVLPPPRQLSDEAKFRLRRMRLERRMLRKYPMFAEQFVREMLLRKPDYYGLTPEQARSWRIGAST